MLSKSIKIKIRWKSRETLPPYRRNSVRVVFSVCAKRNINMGVALLNHFQNTSGNAGNPLISSLITSGSYTTVTQKTFNSQYDVSKEVPIIDGSQYSSLPYIMIFGKIEIRVTTTNIGYANSDRTAGVRVTYGFGVNSDGVTSVTLTKSGIASLNTIAKPFYVRGGNSNQWSNVRDPAMYNNMSASYPILLNLYIWGDCAFTVAPNIKYAWYGIGNTDISNIYS